MTELELDRSALPEREGEPVYRRIVQLLTGYIQDGTLREGAQLPTVRALAEQLGVAQGTVKRAYDELERQGIRPALRRRLTDFEYRSVLDEADRLGITGYRQGRASAQALYTPDFKEGIVQEEQP